MTRGLLSFGALIAMATLSSGCPDDTSVYVSPAWCGEQPCLWTVDEGEVGRGPTWHEQDPALVLVSDRVRLSHLFTPSDPDVRCTGISFLGDASWSAAVFFELDAGDDGTVEHSTQLVADWFERIEVQVNPNRFPRPTPIRIILRKEGPYRASFADLRLLCADVCPGSSTDPPASSTCN